MTVHDQPGVPAVVDAAALDDRLRAERLAAVKPADVAVPVEAATTATPSNAAEAPVGGGSVNYERVRVQGHRMFYRCLKCRCLLEEINREQEAHDAWHTTIEGQAPVVVNASTGDGWD